MVFCNKLLESVRHRRVNGIQSYNIGILELNLTFPEDHAERHRQLASFNNRQCGKRNQPGATEHYSFRGYIKLVNGSGITQLANY